MADERDEQQQWESDQRLESIASRDEPLDLHAKVGPPPEEPDEASHGTHSSLGGRLLDRLRKLVGGQQ